MDLIPALIPGGRTSDLTPCQDYYTTSDSTDSIQQRIQSVAGQLAEALTQIRHRAPRARVYVVGYPDLLPASGGGSGDGFINTYAPSEGHDACAAPANRWIEPLIPDAPAAPLHPNAVGEQGMADVIADAIKAAA
jgi:hypothetical protein